MQSTMIVSSDHACGRSIGPATASAEVKITISSAATNGRAWMHGRTLTYQSHPGFKGTDMFRVRLRLAQTESIP